MGTIIGPLYVDPESLKALREIQYKQNMNFVMLGVCVMEYDTAADEAMKEPEREKRVQRLGELADAHMKSRAFFKEAITRAEKEQAEVGQKALNALGLDRKDEYYAIETANNGRVLRLLDGYWWARWENQTGLDFPISAPAEHKTVH